MSDPILRDLSNLDYHPISKKLVDVIQQRCKQNEEHYFHNLVSYYLAKVATTMRVAIITPDGSTPIPVNVYVLNLATSGFGKGKSQGIIENEILSSFKERFLEETYPVTAECNIINEGSRRAARSGTDPDEEIDKLRTEFNDTGSYLFEFDSATTPAVKQMRHQLLLSKAGCLNLEIDEIGANLSSSNDVLVAFLELYDKGLIKNKLIKNTAENKRGKEIFGSTPANLLAFGTPSKLMDGGKNEDLIVDLLTQGFGRRFFFCLAKSGKRVHLPPGDELALMKASTASQFLCDLSDQLMQLADPVNLNKQVLMEDDVAIHWISYRINCEQRADELPEHQDVLKAELNHRYWKAMKLAGVYAFIDGSYCITEDHFYYAVKVAEESGNALEKIMTRDRAPVKLAKYLASSGEVTQYDLVQELPFYKGTAAAKQELMNLAISWGYKNNVLIKRSFVDGIEFINGESLEITQLDQMRFSYSADEAFNYSSEIQPFEQLHKLTQATGLHWVNHHVEHGHRVEENCKGGFNMMVIDVDGGVDMDTAKLLLKKYTYLLYTTKRHTDQKHRFRIVIPTNYTLKLDAKEYVEFMENIYNIMPFDSDTSTAQRSRKWLTFDGEHEYNYAELFDVLPYIPKTAQNETRQKDSARLGNLNNLERWFINATGEGNRSNNLVRYAMLLVDSGQPYDEVEDHVKALNTKLPDKLSESEIMGTIMKTVHRRIIARDVQAAS